MAQPANIDPPVSQSRKPIRLIILTWDEGSIGIDGAIQKFETDHHFLFLMIVSPEARTPLILAKLLSALLVDEAEQVIYPTLMPPLAAEASLLSDGRWQCGRARTLPPWAEREIERLTQALLERHRSFFEASVDAVNGDLKPGFSRPDSSSIIQDDTGHTVVVDHFPRIDVDVSDSDRARRSIGRDDLVRLDYRRDRYMRHLSDRQIEVRLLDVISNATNVTQNGLIGLESSGDRLAYWMPRMMEVVEEMSLRYGPFPACLERGNFKVPRELVPGSLATPHLGTARALVATQAPTGPVVVKYGPQQYLRPLIETGAVRISPASRYNDASLNAAIKDDELSANLDVPVELVAPTHEWAGAFAPGTRVHAVQRMNTNYYVWCTANVLELRLLFDFAADCCVVIHDVNAFRERLSRAMATRLPRWLMTSGDLSYYDPLQVVPKQVTLPMSKHFRYAYQSEHRFVWTPPAPVGALEPLDIELGPLHDIAELILPDPPIVPS